MLSIPNQVVIVGHNVHSVISAMLLREKFTADICHITVVGEPPEPELKQALVVDKHINQLLERFEKTEAEWMQKVSATFKLRNHYVGWSKNPFSLSNHCDVDIYYHPLLMELTKLKREKYNIDFNVDDFFFTSSMAAQNLSPKGQDFPFDMDYQYQVDSHELIALLKPIAEKHEIRFVDQSIETLELDKKGNIKQVESASEVFQADYYIDCSEYQQILIGNMPGHTELELQPLRIHDRILTARVKGGTPSCQTRTIAMQSGFIKHFCLNGEQEFQYHYSSKFLPDGDALESLTALVRRLGFNQLQGAHLSACTEHLVESAWIDNCLAIGKAQGYCRQTEEHEIAHTFYAIDTLIKSIQSDNNHDEILAVYNASVRARLQHCLAFSDTLLLFNGRRDSPYWKTPQVQSALPVIAHPMMSQWLGNQDIMVDTTKDVIGKFGWYCLLAGLEMYPPDVSVTHPAIDAINDNIEDMRKKLSGCCLNFPPHSASLAGESNHVE